MTNNLRNWPSFSKAEIQAVQKVLLSNNVNYWTGEECKKFEKEYSKWSNSAHAIALSNGTVALDLALKAVKIKKGDEVIVTPRSFIASVSSVVQSGATPIFADVDKRTGNLSAETISKKITKKTKAIICVHLGGIPCEMDPIMDLALKRKIYVIEDCAQAHGAKYKGKSVGSIGDIGAWSFCQDKIMTTGGEGGMVTTNNKAFWESMWSFKDHGKDFDSVNRPNKDYKFKWVHDSFGTNFRMTEMQGVLGRYQLKRMDSWNKLRIRNAKRIEKIFKNFEDSIDFYQVPEYINPAYYRVYGYLKPEKLKKSWSRDLVIRKINQDGVPCFSGSCPEIYREKAFIKQNLAPPTRLSNAKLLGETSIAFLCHPNLRIKDLNSVENKITRIFKSAFK